MKNNKNLEYYLNLPWTYTIEKEIHKDATYYSYKLTVTFERLISKRKVASSNCILSLWLVLFSN